LVEQTLVIARAIWRVFFFRPILRHFLKKIRGNASKTYSIKAIVDKYMDCIEEVINIPTLNDRFNNAVKQGYLNKILNEVVIQSKVEFNYEDTDDDEE
jgi:hypothetical protein